jgi:hypothetical protein
MQFFPSQYAMGDHARQDTLVFALGLRTTTHTSGDMHIVFAWLKLTSEVTFWQFEVTTNIEYSGSAWIAGRSSINVQRRNWTRVFI